MRSCLFLFGVMALSGLCGFAQEEAKVEILAKSDRMWDGTPLPGYPAKNPEVTIIKVTFPPKTVLPMHKHPVINAGYLLKGELTVFSETGEVLNLKEGDPIIELVDKWHYGINEGEEPAEILVFYAGEKGVPLAIKQATEEN